LKTSNLKAACGLLLRVWNCDLHSVSKQYRDIRCNLVELGIQTVVFWFHIEARCSKIEQKFSSIAENKDRAA